MKSHYYLLLFVFVLLVNGCKDAEIILKDYPLIITNEVSEIDTKGVTLQAEILVKGTDQITDFGFIMFYGTDSIKYSVFKSGLFKKRILSDLKPNVKYKCKAYLTTTHRLIYGNVVEFQSLGSSLPIISDFVPRIGTDGDTVKLVGKYFSQFSGGNRIYINNVEAEIIQSTDSSIVFIIPNQKFVGNANIIVEVNSVKVNPTQKFTIIGPEITSVTSFSEKPGKIITLNGSNFLSNGSKFDVYFGMQNSLVLSVSNNQANIFVPSPDNVFEDMLTTITITNGFKSYTYPSTI